MSFTSYAFIVFYAVVLAWRLVSARARTRAGYLAGLLLSSLIFYSWYYPPYVGILVGSAAVDFLAGRAIQRAGERSESRRKVLLAAAIGTNLALLALFKYLDFILESGRHLLSAFGLDPGPAPGLGLLLPIGISFYTFQSMSYSIDVYRGRIRPVESFWRFLLYVSFFPQLVAGPIVRARDFLYQLGRPRPPRKEAFLEGGYLIARGFFLKMVLADNIAPVVDRYFPLSAQPDAVAPMALLSTLLFACQIFCDFAGYSSIARGLAYQLGFRLPVNFDSPYIARSFSDFWRRWHISLSQWLRDYLYIPLGGNRRGAVRTYLNLCVVMLLGGLWHGAALHFVVWGAIHGAALAAERLLGLGRDMERRPAWVKVLWRLVVFSVVMVTWVFFRASSCGEAVTVLRTLVAGSWSFAGCHGLLGALLYAIPLVAMHARGLVGADEASPREKAFYAGLMLYAILTLRGPGDDFIYFQF